MAGKITVSEGSHLRHRAAIPVKASAAVALDDAAVSGDAQPFQVDSFGGVSSSMHCTPEAKTSRARRVRTETREASTMQSYLQRCYAQCESGDSRQLMKTMLTAEIARITAAGELSSTSWGDKPLIGLAKGVADMTSGAS